jgi:hypothetical protein
VSEPSGFKVSTGPPSGGCFELDTSQYKIACVGQNATGKWVFRVTNMIVKNTNTNSTGCTGNSGLINPAQTNYVIPTVIGSYTVSNIQPSTISGITTTSPKTFSFDIESNTPNPTVLEVKTQFANVCTDNTGSMSECTASPRLKFEDLPSCLCTSCDSVKINLPPATKGQLLDNVTIVQTISTQSLPSNAALAIKSITAEIIYFDIIKNDTLCYRCEKNSDNFGKFKIATLSNTAFTNTTTPLPNNEVLFTAATAQALTNATFNFEIAAPNINKCCTDKINACIRYTIVTQDCKTCSITQCYELPRIK